MDWDIDIAFLDIASTAVTVDRLLLLMDDINDDGGGGGEGDCNSGCGCNCNCGCDEEGASESFENGVDIVVDLLFSSSSPSSSSQTGMSSSSSSSILCVFVKVDWLEETFMAYNDVCNRGRHNVGGGEGK